MKKYVSPLTSAVIAAGAFAQSAPAHRSGCHRAHSCPSITPRTSGGKLCVKPSSSKRTSAFRQRVRYGGLTYYCK